MKKSAHSALVFMVVGAILFLLPILGVSRPSLATGIAIQDPENENPLGKDNLPDKEKPQAPTENPPAPQTGESSGKVSDAKPTENSPALLPDGTFASPVMGTVDVRTTLRIRTSPWGTIIGGLQNADQVKVIGISGDFYKIDQGGRIGFVHRRYISIQGFPSRQYIIVYPPGIQEGDGSSSGVSGGNSGQTTGTETTGPPPTTSKLPEGKTSGSRAGDGTVAGAVTWGRNQMAGGAQAGVNSNNGQSSKSITAWNHYCLAFVATAYGRKINDLQASTAYNAYKKCRNSGRKFSKGGSPPPGAVFFTGPTRTNKAGHVFFSTGEFTADGEPLILTTTGYGGLRGIQKITVKRMTGMLRGAEYLGWTPMP